MVYFKESTDKNSIKWPTLAELEYIQCSANDSLIIMESEVQHS